MRGRDQDHGSGLLSTAAGVSAFVGFMLLAVHMLVGLYATTVVSSAGFDAARRVAVGGGNEHAVDMAERGLHTVLGRAYDDIAMHWDLSDPSVVRLTVVADNPNFLPAALDGPMPFDRVERTFIARVERPQ